MAEMTNGKLMKVLVNGVNITADVKFYGETREVKKITEITRDEWIIYAWIDITAYCDEERFLARGHKRTPTEGAQAAQDWEVWQQAARNLAKGE